MHVVHTTHTHTHTEQQRLCVCVRVSRVCRQRTMSYECSTKEKRNSFRYKNIDNPTATIRKIMLAREQHGDDNKYNDLISSTTMKRRIMCIVRSVQLHWPPHHRNVAAVCKCWHSTLACAALIALSHRTDHHHYYKSYTRTQAPTDMRHAVASTYCFGFFHIERFSKNTWQRTVQRGICSINTKNLSVVSSASNRWLHSSDTVCVLACVCVCRLCWCGRILIRSACIIPYF